MKKTERAPLSEAADRGSIELKVGTEQYATLAVTGFLGTLPLLVWGGGVASLFANHTPSSLSFPVSPSWSVAGNIFGVIVFVALLAAPSLVPCLVLRARQRAGARIEWDQAGVTEWDGPWRRNVIPWNRMNAAVFSFKMVASKSSYGTYHVVQLRERDAKTVTTVWEMRPDDGPVVRRRLISKAIAALEAAVRAHGVPTTDEVDYSAIEESERRRLTGARVWIARLGYFGAVVGPLTAFPSPVVGIVISVLSASLLAWRALPVLHELDRLAARVRSVATGIERMPEKPDDPYRAAAPHEIEKSETREAADRIRLTAVRVEAAVRVSFVLLTLIAAIANAADATP